MKMKPLQLLQGLYFKDNKFITLPVCYTFRIFFTTHKNKKKNCVCSVCIMCYLYNTIIKILGTWIDWQYLFTAANLLAKCRYTLQYTYPFAYYMDAGPRKELFEYQQAQLEAEIENLSWKIERAETTDRGDLENQMDIAEKRRTTLLKDFLDV